MMIFKESEKRETNLIGKEIKYLFISILLEFK